MQRLLPSLFGFCCFAPRVADLFSTIVPVSIPTAVQSNIRIPYAKIGRIVFNCILEFIQTYVYLQRVYAAQINILFYRQVEKTVSEFQFLYSCQVINKLMTQRQKNIF